MYLVSYHSFLLGLDVIILICSKIFSARHSASNSSLDGDWHPAGTNSYFRGHRWHEVYEVPGRRRGPEDADGCHWGRDISYFW